MRSLSPILLPVPSGSLQIVELEKNSLSQRQTEFSLVIPTYNERKNLRLLIEYVTRLLDNVIPESYELIIVDDDSPDLTWELGLEISKEYPQVRVIRRIKEKGLSTAVIRGWQASKGSILGVIDGDLQHPPEVLLQLWSEIKRGADLAVASRHIEGGGVSEWSIARRLLSRGAQTLGLIILPGVVGRVSDPMSGYFLIRRNCLVGCSLNPLGYKILIEVLGMGKIGWLSEVGYVFQERKQGESKVSYQHYFDYLVHLFSLRIRLLPLARFIRFGVVGFSGVFVDLAVFYLLREIFGLGLTRSAILSAQVAIFNNFIWNDIWTFGDLARQQQDIKHRFKRFIKFNLICLSGLIINVLIVNLLFNGFQVNEYLAKIIAIACVTLWNFWLNLKLSWRVTQINK